MKTEDFDEAIRKKVESLYSAHTQEDVERVQRFVEMSQAKKTGGKYIFFALIPFVLLTLGSLIMWNVSQLKERDQLRKTVEVLKKGLKQAKITNNVLSKQKDTVFITKYLSNKNHHSTLIKKEKDTEQNNYLTQAKTIFPGSPKRNKYTNPNFSPRENSRSKINKTYHSVENRVMPADEKDQNSESIARLSLPVSFTDSLFTNENNDVALTIPANTGYEFEKNKFPVLKDSIENQTETASAGKLIAMPVDSSLSEKLPGNPAIVSDWKYRAGISLEAGINQTAYGIIGEAVFRNKWSVSFGFKRLKNGDENFDDDDDYSEHKKKEFKNTYGDRVHDTLNYNINIKNTIYQIPIMLSYNYSLKRNFSLLFGIGTDIDVYIKQHVAFNHVVSSNDIVNQKFAANYSPVYFNNAVITVGVQKIIHHFIFQASPYLSPQIEKANYKSRDLYYGLRFRVLYQF